MTLLLAMGLAASAAAQAPGPSKPRASRPAPATAVATASTVNDWRDQVMYFAMTDRFDDGDPANNDQGAGEYNPASNAHYSGGDLRGLQRRLDYIQGLGATALWITPPVANQWWNGQYSGYHGYWAEHFAQVDKHLGSLADYKALADDLHRRGMRLVQDIVVNHTGDYFSLAPGTRPQDAAAAYRPNPASRPTAAPTQAPFDQNDARKPAQRAAGIYHWTPDVADFSRRQEVLTGQMSGLDDLNTENPAVRRALRQSYAHWVREVGVDAFRVDTAFYVPPSYFTDFLRAPDPQAPGLQRVAAALGRPPLFVFGEGFAMDKPFAEREARKIEAYVRGPRGQVRLDGMLNFPLYGSLGEVLSNGAPTAVLGHRIASLMRVHQAPHLMPSFVDNHDVDRFLAGGSAAGLAQALLAIMTLPGIPVVYYGTEQGFTEQRGSMFAAGFGSGGKDHFDSQSPGYRLLQRLTTLRREHRLFSRGTPTVLQADAHGPGVLAWRMQHGPDAALVVINTADTPRLLQAHVTGVASGTGLPGLLALSGEPTALQAGPGGQVLAVLPPHSGQVWRLPANPDTLPARNATGQGRPSTPTTPVITRARLDSATDTLDVAGRAAPGRTVQLLLDGQTDRATPAQADARGQWQARLPTGHLADARRPHQVVAWSPGTGMAAGTGLASAPRDFALRRTWQAVASATDPAGDDTGPDGHYTYPTDPSWGANRQMDLRGARVWRAGEALRIDLALHRLTSIWKPQNGFDHVAFTLYFSQPGRADGQTVLPMQNAVLPEGRRWQHRLRVHGWSNALFSAEGAGPQNEGRPITPGAQVAVDLQRHTVRFTLPAGALGPGDALSGLRIYATTWDYDGGYRGLGPVATRHQPGGGTADSAKVMDDLWVALPP